MKKIKLIIVIIISLYINSCKKHETHSSDHSNHSKNLNINYPALYVVNGHSNNISVIRLSDNTVSETIELNGATFPHHIHLNPSKSKLAVAITSTDLSDGHGSHGGAVNNYKVQIIDAITGKIDKEIVLSKMPHNAIFNNKGNELWIGQSDQLQSQINIYNVETWDIIQKINVGKGLSEITFTNDGLKAFACNTDGGTVSIIDVKTKDIDTTISVGNGPVGAWSASNGSMFVDNEISQTIVELSDKEIINTIQLDFKPGYVAFHSTLEELWVSDATNGKVAIYKLINYKWELLDKIKTGKDAHAIVFNKDGTKAYVTNQNEGTVSIIDVKTHLVVQTIHVGSKPNGIAIKE